jgi:hypothetical protein
VPVIVMVSRPVAIGLQLSCHQKAGSLLSTALNLYGIVAMTTSAITLIFALVGNNFRIFGT